MTRPTRTLILTLAAVLAMAGSLSAHMAYSKSAPEKDATLTTSPAQIQVWFTQDPEPALSQLSLEGPTGEIEIGETTVGAEKSIVAGVPTALGPGSYTVKWRAAGDDGHAQRGEFTFNVRNAN